MTAFKLDENLHPDVAEVLGDHGHDVTTVFSQHLRGTADERLIQICHEEGRALMTLDVGFADIRRYPPESYSGIVVLRLTSQSKKHVLRITRQLAPTLHRETLVGRLWIVTEQGIRIHAREA